MDHVRLGLIGCGGFARYRISRMLEIPEVAIVALADPDADQIGRTCQAYQLLQGIPTFDSHRDMLEKVEMDAIAIATPHTQHFQQVLDSLERGKHVICEKPLVTSSGEARQLI